MRISRKDCTICKKSYILDQYDIRFKEVTYQCVDYPFKI
jgi:hypothetical protein